MRLWMFHWTVSCQAPPWCWQQQLSNWAVKMVSGEAEEGGKICTAHPSFCEGPHACREKRHCYLNLCNCVYSVSHVCLGATNTMVPQFTIQYFQEHAYAVFFHVWMCMLVCVIPRVGSNVLHGVSITSVRTNSVVFVADLHSCATAETLTQQSESSAMKRVCVGFNKKNITL